MLKNMRAVERFQIKVTSLRRTEELMMDWAWGDIRKLWANIINQKHQSSMWELSVKSDGLRFAHLVDQGIIEMDTISDFEVTPAGGNHNSSHHDWISETGVSEDTPLFSDKSPSSRHSSAPADSYRKVWIVFYMLGKNTDLWLVDHRQYWLLIGR